MGKKLQGLREKWRVIEYKNGCVYKTQSIGYVWADTNVPRSLPDSDIIYSSISTTISKQLDGKDYRWVDNDTPSIVDCELPSV